MDSISILVLSQIINLHFSFDNIKRKTRKPHESSWKGSKWHNEPKWRLFSSSIRSNRILYSLHILIKSKIECISPGISNHGWSDASKKTSKTILTVDFLSCVHARFVQHSLSSLNLHSNSNVLDRTSNNSRNSSSNSSRYQELRNRQLINVLLFCSCIDVHHKSLHDFISCKLNTHNRWNSSQRAHCSLVKSSRTFIVPDSSGQIYRRNWVALCLHSYLDNVKRLTHKHL